MPASSLTTSHGKASPRLCLVPEAEAGLLKSNLSSTTKCDPNHISDNYEFGRT
jgi:hypothetical protein